MNRIKFNTPHWNWNENINITWEHKPFKGDMCHRWVCLYRLQTESKYQVQNTPRHHGKSMISEVQNGNWKNGPQVARETYSIAFSWVKMFTFWFILHVTLFPHARWHNTLVSQRNKAITWTHVDHVVSPGLNVLTGCGLMTPYGDIDLGQLCGKHSRTLYNNSSKSNCKSRLLYKFNKKISLKVSLEYLNFIT